MAWRLDLVFTPAHGSWLNMAESELSVLTRQALGDRIASMEEVRVWSHAWAEDRNRRQNGHRLAVHHRQRPHQTQAALTTN